MNASSPADAGPAPTHPGRATGSEETTTPVGLGSTRYVRGLNGFVAFDNVLGLGTFTNPSLYTLLFGALHLRPGYGFSLSGLKLAATASWEMGFDCYPGFVTGSRLTWTDVGLRLSAPELFRESNTNLTFTPGFGVTVPVSFSNVLTVLSAGARLEWSHRNVEVGYRVEVARPFYMRSAGCYSGGSCIGPQFQLTLSNALLVEANPTERFSFGVRLSLDSRWRQYLYSVPEEPVSPSAPRPSNNPRSDSLGWELFATLGVTQYFGATLSLQRQVPLLRAYTTTHFMDVDNQTLLALSLWARSHDALSKYWLLW